MRIAYEQLEAITTLNTRISKELGQIIHRCLEMEPDRRYQLARDLAVDLKNLSSQLDVPKPCA